MKELLRRLRDAYLAFFRRLPALREATVYPDDVFLVSYPKSGNTWLRFLLGNLAYGNDPVSFDNVEQRIPSIYQSTNGEMQLVRRPRYIKSHEPFHPRYQNVIYVVRDPRDVAVSYYHFSLKLKKISANSSTDSFVKDLIADYVPNPCGTWADHVMGWLAMERSRRSFLLLRYEDLIDNTARELSKVAAFLNLPTDEETLNQTIRLSSADRMRRLEKEEWKKWDETKRTRGEIPFIRAAKSKQWSEALSPQSVMAIEAAWGPVMQALEYKLTNDPAKLAVPSESWARWEAQVRVLWPERLERQRTARVTGPLGDRKNPVKSEPSSF
jgi:Sulfotransferase domain